MNARRTVTNRHLNEIKNAQYHLRMALLSLRAAGANNAARYVARARKSVEGARRHAEGILYHLPSVQEIKEPRD